MRKFKLLVDLLDKLGQRAPQGTILTLNNGFYSKEVGYTRFEFAIEGVENNPDWFEEVEENITILGDEVGIVSYDNGTWEIMEGLHQIAPAINSLIDAVNEIRRK